MNNLEINEVLEILVSLADSIKYNNIFNERYLHHLFSHKLQNKYKILNLTGNEKEGSITLHPEWPINKKKTGINYGNYKGNIDFAIGDYKKPDIGIEFTLKDGWSTDEIVGDFIKLFDKNLPFKVSISFNLIVRENKIVERGWLKDLVDHMNNGYINAVNQLENNFDKSRELYIIVTEMDKENRRHYHFNKTSNKFIEGLPLIPKSDSKTL